MKTEDIHENNNPDQEKSKIKENAQKETMAATFKQPTP